MMKSFRRIMGMVARNNPALLPHILVYALATGLAPLVNIYLPKLMLDELLGGRDIPRLITYAGLLAVLNLIFSLMKIYEENRMEQLTSQGFNYLSGCISQKAMRLSYQLGETKSTQDLLERSEFSTHAIYSMSEQFRGIGMMITLAGGLIILLSYDVRLLLLAGLPTLLSLPCFRRIRDLNVDNDRRSAPEHRAFIYFSRMAEDYRWAKDLRLYQGTRMMLQKAKTVMDRILKINHEYFTKSGFWNGMVRLLVEAQTGAVFLVLGLALAMGRITAGAFTLLYGACRQVGEAMTEMVNLYTRMKTVDINFEPLVEFLALPEEESLQPGDIDDEVQQALRKAREGHVHIQVQDVSFQYPTGDGLVLNHLSMDILPGETLALVGRNGAGKSTLVSLLCRLYPPTAGSILLNGVDVQRIPLKEYRQVLAPTFQDYRLLPLSIEESLLGKKQQDITPQDKARVEDALKQVGVEDFVMASAKGIAAPLTRMLAEDGLVPSGGQDQKLALARAVCRQGTFVILDEPTAALDPRSEEEIFSRMLTLTRGQTSLFISHRLSSTRFADRIIVLDKGQVLQNGSHQQLMDTVGLYQEMYQTQAEAYQET